VSAVMSAIATSGLMQCSRPQLFDHLVGAGEQRRGHLNAEQSRRLRVDDEHEFARLQDRQVGGLFAFEDAADIAASLTNLVWNVPAVAHHVAAHACVYASALADTNYARVLPKAGSYALAWSA
jgi:hypothetical protein